MTTLVVRKCAGFGTVQDAGRFGYRRFGVPVAGAMDRCALAVANTLVGNPPDAAAVELVLAGGRFVLADGPALVAVAGPGATLAVDGQTIPECQSARAAAGAEIAVGGARGGLFAYLAVSGGIAVPEVMGSRSVHARTGIGGAMLRAGERLPVGPSRGTAPMCLPGPAMPPEGGAEFRILAGPQFDEFEPQAGALLCSEPFSIDTQSDRMAYRLRGPALIHPGGHNIVSDGVVPGAIQVPGDMHPLVLMRDCQTTGGYPKIATVISADLPRLAQTRPGREIRFRMVARPEALAAARALRDWEQGLADALRPVAPR